MHTQQINTTQTDRQTDRQGSHGRATEEVDKQLLSTAVYGLEYQQ